MSRSSITRKWVSALVLTLGVGVVWATAAGIIGSIISGLIPSNRVTYESVVVVADGTPLIQARSSNNYFNTELRTLDGQTVELEEESWLGGVSFAEPYRAPGVVQLPITWSERIAGCSDYGKPPVNWLLMRDDRRPGSAYFTGYDTESKLGVGYLGSRGFRPAVPPADKQFDLGNHSLDWSSSAVTSVGDLEFGHPPNNYGIAKPEENRTLASWIVFLVDGNEIREVDLRNRKVRTIGKLDQLLSLGIASQPLPPNADEDVGPTDEPEETGLQSKQSQPAFHLAAMQNDVIFSIAPNAPINPTHKSVHRLLARCAERIVALNPFNGSQQEFALPESLRNAQFSAYLVAADELLLQVYSGFWEHGSITDLYWLNTAGEVTREEKLRLAGYPRQDERKQLPAIAAVAPSLICWVVGAVGVAPLIMLQTHHTDSYLAGLSEAIAVCWPALVEMILLSAVLTWLVYRWQQKYCRSHTGLWCATVFATTVPGILAYWLMHRGTVLEACGECRQPAPRDRDACAHCGKPFAGPSLLGTEILT